MGVKSGLVAEMKCPVAASYDIEHKVLRGSGVARWYNPLEDRKLPREFARVTDDRSLLAFAHKYGELGYHFIEDVITRPEYYNDRINQPGEPVEWILKHANQVRVFLRLYGILRDTLQEWDTVDRKAFLAYLEVGQWPDWSMLPPSLSRDVTKAVRDLERTTPGVTIETAKDGTESTKTSVIMLNGGEGAYVEGFERGHYGNEDIALIYRLAHSIVNENTHAVMVDLREAPDKRTRPDQASVLQCNSLLEAVYYLLKTALLYRVWEGEDEPRPCRRRGCPNTFKSIDHRRQFCSDECKDKHRRECNRLYQMKWRNDPERKRRNKEGQVVSE